MRVFRKATRPWGEWLSSKNSLGWHLGRRGLKIKTAFREGCPVQPEAFSCRCPGTRSPGRSSEPSGPRGCSQADPLLGLRMEPQVSTRLAKPLPGRREVPRSARVSPREFPALLGPQSESDVGYHPSPAGASTPHPHPHPTWLVTASLALCGKSPLWEPLTLGSRTGSGRNILSERDCLGLSVALKKDFCTRLVKNGKEDFIQGWCNRGERVSPECGKDS